MKKLLMIVIPILLLFGCQRGTGVLNPPKNIFYNESSMTITWDDIENANEYVIQVNEQIFNQTENLFDMSMFNTGDYQVKIKAIYDKGESYFSNALTIRIVKNIDIQFTFQDYLLKWSAPMDNLQYKVIIYGQDNQLLDEILTNEFEIEVNEQGYSRYQFEAYFYSNLVYQTTIHFDMSGYVYARGIEDLNIYTNINGVVKLDSFVLIAPTHYEMTESVLKLSQTTLESKMDGTYLFSIIGNEEIYYTWITITSIDSPKLISNPYVSYDGVDLIFDFELYGGIFLGLGSTPNIPSNMYSFVSNRLTINHTFIDQVILDQPERKTIIFSYVLENGPFTIVGYLSVNLK